ncbi:hypothetical protein [Streptomyces sp. ISL-100]|uniref:hypothetical protein n=1 Tax=Streptomyces sp. ISL-100 TaxID=2819173 RepID=UPI001BEA12C2|nr:hypothetical protein [Streptomyces sp. ISL-100]MBT2400149.1 hypothetical protein [Streptomyces sp. ISL-100]
MTRRNAALDARAALCGLLLAVTLLCEVVLAAAGGVELSAGGTSRKATSLPDSPGESRADQDPLDKLPLRNGGRHNSPPTAQAPPTGGHPSPA